VHAIAVDEPRARFGQVAVPDLIGAFGQDDALAFAPSSVIEQRTPV